MSEATALVPGTLVAGRLARDRQDERSAFARSARFGAMALIVAAPFEALRPLLQVPGQSLSTVETVLLAVFALSALTAATGRVWPVPVLADVLPWGLFVLVALGSAVVAPAFRGNALHMAARVGIAAAVWGLTVTGAASPTTRRQIVEASVVTGTVVALLVVADFFNVAFVARWLSAFRTGVAIVGAQVRASGPFQYPTIASMYLEIVFALGLGLLVSSAQASAPALALLVGALALMAEAIVLTFTRAGLITMALSLAVVGTMHWRRNGLDRAAIGGLALAALIAIELLSSRSAEMLMLRLTSEGQGRWFSAAIEAPSVVVLDTQHPVDVPVTITNTGRATWDSYAAEPIRLSYHWVATDSDEVIAWEGIRTVFATPVRPGQTVSMRAQVGGPGRPGRFRLMWDVEQAHRLWFSTEPEAEPTFTPGVVTGPVTATRPMTVQQRIAKTVERPGRLVLWAAAFRMFAARPFLGVGPDNYRLLYGRYSTLTVADPRIHSNNMYIEVLAGMGLVGLGAMLWVAARAALAAFRAARTSALGLGIAAACAAIAVHGLVDSFLAFTGTYILIAVALGLASACGQEGERHAHRV